MTVVEVQDHGNIYLVAKMVAASSTFQSVVGAASETEAFNSIHYPYIDLDDQGEIVCPLEPPRAILSDELGEDEYLDGAIHTWSRRETFWLSFDFAIPKEYRIEGNVKNSWAWFRLKIQAIVKEMRLAGKTASGVTPTGGQPISYPALRAMRRVEGPYQLSTSERMTDHPDDGPPPEVWHIAFAVERGN